MAAMDIRLLAFSARRTWAQAFQKTPESLSSKDARKEMGLVGCTVWLPWMGSGLKVVCLSYRLSWARGRSLGQGALPEEGSGRLKS